MPPSVPPIAIESKAKKKKKPPPPDPFKKPVEPKPDVKREKIPIPTVPKVETFEETKKPTVDVADTKRTFWYYP